MYVSARPYSTTRGISATGFRGTEVGEPIQQFSHPGFPSSTLYELVLRRICDIGSQRLFSVLLRTDANDSTAIDLTIHHVEAFHRVGLKHYMQFFHLLIQF